MNRRLMMAAAALAVCAPTLAMAQQQPAYRGGNWEFSLGAGILFVDSTLRDFLGSGAPEFRFADDADPGGTVPLGVARLGYNFNENFGVSVSGEMAKGSGITYYTPAAALTYTLDLDSRTSPFFLVGTGLTRIEGENDRVTHSTWGALAGLGLRHMVGESVALRLEGRVQIENYDEVPMDGHTVVHPLATLGLSFFTGGSRPAMAARTADCPACRAVAARGVDTVVVFRPFPVTSPPVIAMRDTLVLDGVNFAFDESVLTPESHDVLDRVARALQESEWANVRFEVAGHTSTVATERYNMFLSERRAEAVRSYLASRGVANGRMTVKGYGETQPISTEDSEGDAWQNRRVELRRLY